MNAIETFCRAKADSSKLYGRVVGESSRLICLQKEEDFIFDGFIILPKKDITKRYTSDSNNHCAFVMKREGLWPRIPDWVRKIDLSRWQTALESLHGKVIIAENEAKDDFLIGPLMHSGRSSVIVKHFDGVGDWVGEFTMRTGDISIIKFLCRYATYHSKYLTGLTSR